MAGFFGLFGLGFFFHWWLWIIRCFKVHNYKTQLLHRQGLHSLFWMISVWMKQALGWFLWEAEENSPLTIAGARIPPERGVISYTQEDYMTLQLELGPLMSYDNEVATCMKDFLSSNRPIALLAYVFSYYNICYTAVTDWLLIDIKI